MRSRPPYEQQWYRLSHVSCNLHYFPQHTFLGKALSFSSTTSCVFALCVYIVCIKDLCVCVCRSSGRGGLRGQDSGNVKLPASFWISFLSLRISPPSLCISLNLVFSQKASSTDLYLCILKLTIYYYIVQSAGTKADVFIRPISKNE